MSEDEENYRLAIKFQKEGKHKEAVETIRKVSEPAFQAGILIDSGTDLGKLNLVREGVALFEAIFNSQDNKFSKESLLYNIGNGYSSIYQLRRLKGAKLIAPNDDDLRKAKRAYRESLVYSKNVPGTLRSQILVNYANCLSALGRSFEAISNYSQAMIEDPRNGMAAGNLGVELGRVQQITGRYTHHYIMAAYDLLSQALGPDMHLSYGGIEAKRAFENSQADLKAIIDAHGGKLLPLKPISLSKTKTAENRYKSFCLKEGLFLNAWVGDQNVAPATSDEIAYGPITTKAKDAKIVPELLNILNEVKEAYITSRYLFYLSQSKSKTQDDVSRLTSYFDIENDNLHGIYLGLCKSAYMRGFDVLDKVAKIANVYFGLGKRNDYFWHIFAEKQSKGETHEIRCVARPAVISTKNYSLYALSDLCIDYFESEQVDLKTIDSRRNMMTHDYLLVKRYSKNFIGKNYISSSELYLQTISVLRLAKDAILYMVSAINIAESQKPTKTNRPIKYKISAGNSHVDLRKIT
ncbi:MAG: LA2681 family HEPN domain-containing protein [Anaerolineales bacterium]